MIAPSLRKSLAHIAGHGPEGMRRHGWKQLLTDIGTLRDKGFVHDTDCNRVAVTGEGLDALAATRRSP